MELSIIEQTAQRIHLCLTGRLDLAGVGEVETRFLALTARAAKPVIIDLAGVDFIASLGMGMLVSAATALRRDRATLVLLQPQPLVAQALRASAIDQLAPIAANLDAAMQLVARQAAAN